MRLFVSGGGTGGHFFPALALIECLLEKSLNSVFVGSERGIEYKLKDKIPTESLFVPAHPFMGRSVKDKLLAILKSFKGAYRVAKLINKKDIGIAFGGYASLPLGLASLMRGASLYVHEQNSIPSQSNRLLSRFAKKVFITFEYSKSFFPSHKTIKTGLPVRKSLINGMALSREEALRRLGLEDEPTLLVMGGSQGANFLNELAKDIFAKTGWQGIHISGEKDYQALKDFYKERGLKVLLFSFSHDMHLIYRASTIALSRSGASSITELSLYGIPSLFIPFPHAIYDHQFYNAKEIEELGGGITIRQEEAHMDKVLASLQKLMENHSYYSKNISLFANPLACEEIIKYLLSKN